jgi:hypothetical protein
MNAARLQSLTSLNVLRQGFSPTSTKYTKVELEEMEQAQRTLEIYINTLQDTKIDNHCILHTKRRKPLLAGK